MKIIVMDSANVRIEVLNVPDHMINEDIEQFLTEHDYSLNNISWMAAPIDFVPVQFHDYSISQPNGEFMHASRHARLKDFTIYDSVQEVKNREQEELATALRLHGEKVDDGYEWHFEVECSKQTSKTYAFFAYSFTSFDNQIRGKVDISPFFDMAMPTYFQSFFEIEINSSDFISKMKT